MTTALPDAHPTTPLPGHYVAHLSMFPVTEPGQAADDIDPTRDATTMRLSITVTEQEDGTLAASAQAMNPDLSPYLDALIRALAGPEAQAPA